MKIICSCLTVSNAFVFLIAGHGQSTSGSAYQKQTTRAQYIRGAETTAGTLTALFAFLALHPHCQQRLFEEASTVIGDGTVTSYPATYQALPYTLAVVQETLRIAGPAQNLLRRSLDLTTLPSKSVNTDGSSGESRNVIIPAGSYIREHVLGVHYSDDWENATEFRPERFLELEKGGDQLKSCRHFDSVSHRISGYSACSTLVCQSCRSTPALAAALDVNFPSVSHDLRINLVRSPKVRFFCAVESVALVASIVSKYRIDIPPHEREKWALKDNESEDERRDRVLQVSFFSNGLQQRYSALMTLAIASQRIRPRSSRDQSSLRSEGIGSVACQEPRLLSVPDLSLSVLEHTALPVSVLPACDLL